ncbi:MAG TPA: hypothetical protein VIY48_07260 [Candidatus Paceibacterota bacterium]
MLYYNELTERQCELVLLDLRERVAKGVELLDAHDPGWRHEVDVEKLDILDEEYCILGQVFGDYFEGKGHLGIAFEPGSIYGFDTYHFSFEPSSDGEYVMVGSGVIKDEWMRHL